MSCILGKRPSLRLVLCPMLAGAIFCSCGPASRAGSDGLMAQSASLTIDPSKELVINDLSVVEDPTRTVWQQTDDGGRAAWTFGHLVRNMAGEHDPSDFVLQWLKTWEAPQVVNGRSVAARPSIRSLVIDPWRQASGCDPGDSPCYLDFSRAPFRLLAIVNRPDLRTFTPDAGGDAGQGRFVFGVLNPASAKLQFTAIFEYSLIAQSTDDVTGWAQRWHNLGRHPFGDTYNQVLQNITEDFAGRNVAPDRPNGSALLQLRTNEVVLSPSTPLLWELREFNISASTGLLGLVTVKQTPDISLNNTQTLADYINGHADEIMNNRAVVPTPLLGGSAPNPGMPAPSPSDFVWRAPGVAESLRHQFAINTCNGCHLSETSTRFTHVKPRNAGVQAALSDFLRLTAIPARVDDMSGLLRGDQRAPEKHTD